MQFEISHLTRYSYDRSVRLMPHLIYLRPRETPLLKVNRFEFTFSPQAQVSWMRDDFDNLPASVRFSSDSATLEIHSRCGITTADTEPFDFLVRDTALLFPFDYEPLHRFNLSIYLMPPTADIQEALRGWLEQRFTVRPRETVAWLFALNQVLHQSLRYQRREDQGIQDSMTTMRLGSGSCRDYAVLLVECARTLGLAARFVSGYLFDSAINGSSPGDMHAWVEIFLPGAGWRGMDPTHGIFCTNAYVPVAQAVVAESVNPIQGAFVSAAPAVAQLSVDVRVRQAVLALTGGEP